jgi:FAD-dependent oxidoreductase domain-containing protein 1
MMDTSPHYDVIIVGGGIMGSTTAYYLTQKDPQLKVIVIERDLAYTRSSTTLSMVNARIQFSLKQNVQISQYAFEVLENFEDEMTVADNRPCITYHREGNLFLHRADASAEAKAAMAMQQALGCQVEWWTPDQVQQHYPLYAPEAIDGVVGATFGAQDGHFDAYAVLMGYKANARAQGAVYVEDEVTELTVQGRKIGGVKTRSGATYRSAVVINCAGAWCTGLAKTAGVDLPVQPTKRQCFCVDTAVKSDRPLPLTILPSGFYFRTETGGMILMGKSLPEDPVGFDFTWDQSRFMEIMWPELAEFVPAFESLKLVRGWAGLYAVNTLDGNAILGPWPELDGFYLANGFSGHGLQQGPAVGRYLSELIIGSETTLDLSVFSAQRILEGKPLAEGGIV